MQLIQLLIYPKWCIECISDLYHLAECPKCYKMREVFIFGELPPYLYLSSIVQADQTRLYLRKLNFTKLSRPTPTLYFSHVGAVESSGLMYG